MSANDRPRIPGITADLIDEAGRVISSSIAPKNGQVAYIRDTNKFVVYDGRAWSEYVPDQIGGPGLPGVIYRLAPYLDRVGLNIESFDLDHTGQICIKARADAHRISQGLRDTSVASAAEVNRLEHENEVLSEENKSLTRELQSVADMALKYKTKCEQYEREQRLSNASGRKLSLIKRGQRKV